MGQPHSVTHALRAPLPWRASRLTECGRLAANVQHAVPLKEAVQLYQESKDLVCETCVQFWRSTDSPAHETSLEREVAWSRRNRHKDHFIDWELQAIGELVTRYHGEFDRIVAALQSEQALRNVGG